LQRSIVWKRLLEGSVIQRLSRETDQFLGRLIDRTDSPARIDDDNGVLQASQKVLIVDPHRLERGAQIAAFLPEPFQLGSIVLWSLFRLRRHRAPSLAEPS